MIFKEKLAVNYALRNWDGAEDFIKNDCTSFVSHCWRAAGIPEERRDNPTDGWYFEDNRDNHHAAAWSHVKTFYDWMVIIQQYCDVHEDGWVSFHEKAELGDIIQFWAPGKDWYHSAIITKIEKNWFGINKSVYYASHTDSHRCKDLSHYWGPVRILHIKDDYRSKEGTLDDPNPEPEGLLENTDPIIMRVQEALNNAGYDCGAPDGIQGPATTEAIKAFQRDNGLYPDGVVGPQTLNALGITRR